MEKIIKVELKEDDDFYERYDSDNVNHNLIEYLIKKFNYTNKNYNIKILIKNKCNLKVDIEEKIIDGLIKEYENAVNICHRNNITQGMLLFFGIIFLFLSTLVNDEFIWKEILLIIGWVPIWEMVDLELFNDFRGNRRKSVIKRIINSEFIIE